jgi:pyruvate formate lyase activating enzyme
MKPEAPGSERFVHEFIRDKCILCGKCADVCLGGALIFYGKEMTVSEVMAPIMEDVDFYNNSGGGATLSGGEPLLQADFCVELLKALKDKGIHTAVDTCGYVPREAFSRALPLTDIFLYDIKLMDPEEHLKYTGASNELIHRNLEYIAGNGATIEIRIPLIPGINNDDAFLNAAGEFLSGIKGITKVKVLPYHALAGSKYRSLDMVNTLPDVASPDDDELRAAAGKLSRYGLNAVSGRD